MVAKAVASMSPLSSVHLTPTPPGTQRKSAGRGFQYDSDTSDSLIEEENANINPMRRRTLGFRVEEGFISPIKALSKSTTPEEDRIPVKIWPAKPAKLDRKSVV